MPRSAHRRGLRPASPKGEEGASVIFALVFLMVIFIILTGVLSYAFAASKNVSNYERDQALRYAADGALEVAVQMVRDQPTLGISAAPAPTPTPGDCQMMLRLGGVDAAHDPGSVFSSTARLNVTCAVTPDVTDSGVIDGDDNQNTRDVTFTVECRLPNAVMTGQLSCATGNTAHVVVLGRARVRYDIDPGYTPTNARARVPKVLSWDVDR